MHIVQEATEMFSKIQNAYQVLSDPQERAFYDRHRESILRKGKRSRVAEAGYSVDDLMNFFDSSVFKGYGDDPKGFYAVYRDLFAFLEDMEAEEADNPAKYNYTSFGSKNTPFEPSLKLFYDKFIHFSSSRSFYEADNYDDGYAENRRHRRAISKENQKYRDAMRREYNDTVRNLTAWVRKRDPRWQSYQKEKTAQRLQAEAKRKEDVIRKRAEMAENYLAPDWTLNDQCIDDEEFLLQQLERLEFEEFSSQKQENGNGNDEEIESTEDFDEFDDFYCVVCKKVFKNHKQWKNHEQSKKHRTNMLKAGFTPESDCTASEIEEISHFESSIASEIDIETDSISGEDEDSDVVDEDEIIIQEILTETQVKPTEIGQKPPKKKIRQRKQPPTETPVKAKPTKSKPPKSKSSSSSDFKCSVCHQVFDSRNKLFRHIEITGHAALKTASNGKKK
jgi:DnaJ homolog subfamily A member 5